jgi:hypothetical protein
MVPRSWHPRRERPAALLDRHRLNRSPQRLPSSSSSPVPRRDSRCQAAACVDRVVRARWQRHPVRFLDGPIDPTEVSTPAARSRSVSAIEVYWQNQVHLATSLPVAPDPPIA